MSNINKRIEHYEALEEFDYVDIDYETIQLIEKAKMSFNGVEYLNFSVEDC